MPAFSGSSALRPVAPGAAPAAIAPPMSTTGYYGSPMPVPQGTYQGMFPQFGATSGWANAPFNGVMNPDGSPMDLLGNFDLFSGELFNNRTNVPASMAKYGDAGPMGNYGDRGPVRPEKPKVLSSQDLILQHLQQIKAQNQQPAAGIQPRFISQQAPGSLGGFYYNGVLRPSNWVPPSAEEMKDPQWEQKRDMALRKKNSERYAQEQSFSSPEEQARYARILAARQQYDRTDGLARSMGFTSEYLTPEQMKPDAPMPVSMRDLGINQANSTQADADYWSTVASDLRESLYGPHANTETVNMSGYENPRDDVLRSYNYTNSMAQDLAGKANRQRSAAAATPQTLYFPKR